MKTMRTRRLGVAIATVGLVFGAAACGDTDEDAGTEIEQTDDGVTEDELSDDTTDSTTEDELSEDGDDELDADVDVDVDEDGDDAEADADAETSDETVEDDA